MTGAFARERRRRAFRTPRAAAVAFVCLVSGLASAEGEPERREPPASTPPEASVLANRVVDGRGNRVADLVRVERVAAGERRTVWAARGLGREDVFLRRRRAVSGPARPDAALFEIWLDDRAALRFERPGGRDAVTASTSDDAYRYFEEDLSRRTVRCALKELAGALDPRLLSAAQEWALLREWSGTRRLEDEEYPIYVLWTVEQGALHPSPPIRRTESASPDDPALAPLRALALAALERE